MLLYADWQEIVDIVCENASEDWQNIVQNLGVSRSEVKRLNQEHNSPTDRCKQGLQLWRDTSLSIR